MTYSSMDPQHRMIFCALECACSSYKPAIFMDSGFLVEAALEVLGGGVSRCLADQMQRKVLVYRRLFVRQIGSTCRFFTLSLFLFLTSFFAMDARNAHGRMANTLVSITKPKLRNKFYFCARKSFFWGIFIDCVENQLLGFLKTEIAPM